MRLKVYAVAAAACIGACALFALALGWSFERAAFLAPVIVAGAGAVAGLVVLWSRVLWETLQRQRHPGRIVALALGAIALLVGLSILGLKLPRE
jgi:hypothetical protein